ncbi:EF-P 5-aminopentanol modification-associated protein YfmH [Abyssisolibacter fermentans]|uniref:EF-P 5-aminopentanol modification-associated protein YfmH n=1 Tax=Abyssisolibacter fermentans TaxID=1766203 RepID=UPI000A40745E|nr:pitrilysin family protein [Abyssisolibacter fermentans]
MSLKKIENARLNEELYSYQFKNGLNVFYVPKPHYTIKYGIFATNYGSNDNRFVPMNENEFINAPPGVAHFLEHKLFEEEEGNIFNKFSKLGSYLNAYTNFNQTAYLFSCTDKFFENLDLLVKFVQNPYFTDENVNKEKGIIEQEIKMYEDNANWRVFFNCLNGLYYNHPVKTDIAGTVKSINKIDKEVLYKCYNTFYHPRNMVIFLVGDIDFDKAIKQIEDSMNKDIKILDEGTKKDYPNEPKDVKVDYIEQKLSVAKPLFTLGFKDTDIGYEGEKLVKKEICTTILLDILFSKSSKFYQDIFDLELINGPFSFQYVGQKDYGHSLISGESKNPKELADRIIKYINETSSEAIDKADFERTKMKFIGYHIMDFNSVEYIANNFISYFFNNFILFDYIDILENIDYDDIISRLNEHLNTKNYTLSVINPL